MRIAGKELKGVYSFFLFRPVDKKIQAEEFLLKEIRYEGRSIL